MPPLTAQLPLPPRLLQLAVAGVVDLFLADRLWTRIAEQFAQAPERGRRFAEHAGHTDLQLKLFLRKHVYESAQLVEERARPTARIAGLFAHFLSKPADLPANYREAMSQQPPHRVACDYIAGMTDGFLNRTWAQLAD